MKKMRLTIFVAIVLVVTMLSLSACTQTPVLDDETEPKATEQTGSTETKGDKVEGTIEIIGSTSVQPLAEKLAEAYMANNSGVTINIQGGGSSVGVKSALDNLCDIGNASRNLKDSEKGQGLIENVIALDGIAVVVHPNNPVANLTVNQVKEIYMGKITNWSEVGGADKDIIVFNREASSGTRGAFIDLTKLEEKQDDGSKKLLVTEKALEANSNGALKTSVSTKEDAIGYVSLGSIDDTIKPVKIGGVEATSENVQSGDYTLYRPFLMLTNGEANATTKSFLDFIFSSEGQAIVADKYISAGGAKKETKDVKYEGTIEIIGSTSVQPLAEILAEAFMSKHGDVTINVQGGGSSVGVKSALDNLCDIGNASRNLKDKEKGKGLVENVVALDGIAVVVHPNNPVSDLTVDEVKKIYMGEITNWSEVGGADKDIIVFNREASSGTRGAFIDLTKLEEKQDDGSKKLLVTEKALESNSNGALKTSVSTKEAAIGYVSLGSIDDTIKALKIGGIEATSQNVQAGVYTLYRPFLMLTNGEPNEITQAFLNFIMSSEGQEIVAKKYISSK